MEERLHASGTLWSREEYGGCSKVREGAYDCLFGPDGLAKLRILTYSMRHKKLDIKVCKTWIYWII